MKTADLGLDLRLKLGMHSLSTEVDGLSANSLIFIVIVIILSVLFTL